MAGSWKEGLRPELEALRAYGGSPKPANVRLDANESPHALSEAARRRVSEVLASIDLHRYPDPRASRLRALVARENRVDEAQIVFGAGSDEIIGLLMTALARPRAGAERARVVYPEPSFVMFRLAAPGRGIEPVEIPLDEEFRLDASIVRDTVERTRPNLVLLPTPNNPTAALFSRESILAAIETAHDAIVVVDEAYFAFSGVTYLDEVRRRDNVAVLRTFSKVGLAAARLGYLVGPPALAAEIDKVRMPYNVSALAQALGILALGDLRDEIGANVRRILQDRDALGRGLAGLPRLRVYPTDANFFWVHIAGDAGAVVRGLGERGVAIRSFDGPGRMSGMVRISVGTAQENARLLDALGDRLR